MSELEIESVETPKVEKINLNEIKEEKAEIDFEEVMERMKKDPAILRQMKLYIENIEKEMMNESKTDN